MSTSRASNPRRNVKWLLHDLHAWGGSVQPTRHPLRKFRVQPTNAFWLSREYGSRGMLLQEDGTSPWAAAVAGLAAAQVSHLTAVDSHSPGGFCG
jgi:hypothetical protein